MNQPRESGPELSAAQRLQELWLQGAVPHLESFLATESALAPAELVGVLRVDQNERWAAHDRQRAEAYFARFPAIACDAEAALDLIYSEYLLRMRHGPPPTIAEFLARFPAQADQLGPQLQLDALAESQDLDAAMHEQSTASQADRSLETSDGLATTELSPLPAGQHAAGVQHLHFDGRLVGNYRLLRELGRGGMGTVWEAEALDSGRRVALKMISRQVPRESDEAAQFIREAQLAASISHPRSAFVLEAGWHEGQPFLVMELMPGNTLRSVAVERDVSVGQAIDYLLDVLDGVEAAHARGVIHRDIKPANCFLDAAGRATIGDYGLALPLVEPVADGRFAGTPAFSSPEQIRAGKVDARSDQYSLGATLYFLLANRPPFVGNFTSLIAQVAADSPPSLAAYVPDLPNGLEQVIRRTLEKDPARRFTNLAALRRALLPFSTSGTFLASVGRRLAAFAIDDGLMIVLGSMLFVALNVLLKIVEQVSPATGATLGRMPLQQMAAATFVALTSFVYFTLAEGWYGGGIGKWLLQLRVVGPDGGPPGLQRAAARAFFVPLCCGWAIFEPFVVPFPLPTSEAMKNFDVIQLLIVPMLLGGVGYLPLLLILSPLFFRRDFRGLHELISNTRVVALRRHTASIHEAHESAKDTKTPSTGQSHFGPFQQVEPVLQLPFVQIHEAADALLRRRARIVTQSTSGAPGYNRVHLHRPTRHRWLQGGTQNGERWDAYELPPSRPLLVALRENSQPSWESLRVVLLDLVEEIVAGRDDGTLPDPVSLAHLDLTYAGRLQLFDWPLLKDDGPAFTGKFRGWQLFEHLIATCRKVPNWPVHAQHFCEAVCSCSEREGAAEWAAGELRAMQHRPASIRWDDRLGMLSLAVVAAGWIMLFCMFVSGWQFAQLVSLDASVRFALHLLLCVTLPGWTTLIFGRGLLLRFLAISIRRTNGSPAGRWHAFLRMVATWLPWSLGGTLSGWVVGTASVIVPLGTVDPHDLLGVMRPPIFYLIFGGGCLLPWLSLPLAWHVLQNPGQSLAERITGTRVVYD